MMGNLTSTHIHFLRIFSFLYGAIRQFLVHTNSYRIKISMELQSNIFSSYVLLILPIKLVCVHNALARVYSDG
jgi:hypothetical protein